MHPDQHNSPAERRQKAMHAIARRLCYFHNRDWRYDPGNPKHEHWREKARLILSELDRYENGGCHEFPIPTYPWEKNDRRS